MNAGDYGQFTGQCTYTADCGSPATRTPGMKPDLTGNCYINFYDLKELAEQWLEIGIQREHSLEAVAGADTLLLLADLDGTGEEHIRPRQVNPQRGSLILAVHVFVRS